MDARLPEDSQQATLRTWATRRCARSSNEFVTAWEQADVDAVVAMLADGAALTMPPIPTWYQGQAAVAAFLARVPLAGPSRRRLVPTRANGQPAFGSYNWDAERKGFVPHEILCSPRRRPDRGDHRFLSTEPFERFGLPAALALPQ